MTPPVGTARAAMVARPEIPDSENLENRWVAASFDLSDGDAISTAWTDSAGSADATVNGSPIYNDNVLNGRPVVSFDAVDDWFDTGLDENTDNERSLYIVARINSRDSYLIGASNSTNNFVGDVGTSDKYYYGYGEAFANPEGFVTGEYRIHAITAVGGTLYWHDNGTQVSSTSWSGAGSVGQTTAIGARHKGDGTLVGYLDGGVADILRYATGHGDQTRQKVESYLNDKYGVF